jgi:alpha-L-fucosidase 2
MRPAVLCLLLAAAAQATLQPDIEYAKAGDVSLKMDASIPDGPGPFPTVILVHGGGWSGGDRKERYFKPFFDPLTQAGFAWFSVDYRLAPKYRYPAAIDDVIASIRFIEDHARDYKIDLRRVALSGESAGGHIVALIGARYGNDLHLAAVVPFFGPTDFEALVAGQDKTPQAVKGVSQFLGITEPGEAARKLMREASPVTWVHPGMPPFLFVHGTADPLVNFRQSEEMCDKMKAAGSRCEILAVEGAGHALGTWERNPAWQAYKQKVPDWLRAQFALNKK